MSEYGYSSADGFSDNDEIELSDEAFSDQFDSHSADELTNEEMKLNIQYSYPTSRTSGGVLTHRMKYRPLDLCIIKSELISKAKELSKFLEIDYGLCINLLIHYKWNENKLLEDYMNAESFEVYLKKYGLNINPDLQKNNNLIKKDTDSLCTICYCESDTFFALGKCRHEFCIDCYTTYVRGKIELSMVLIGCPYATPKCSSIMTIHDLETLSSFDTRKKMPGMPTNGLSQLRISEDVSFSAKSEHTLLGQYYNNLCAQYLALSKKYKRCPFPDCKGVIQSLGFDSPEVVSIEEQQDRLIVPLVKCAFKHEFCFYCEEKSHSPCPCVAVKRWKAKYKDDNEDSVNWIELNTKHCPSCNTSIQKNGGCNHMHCGKCNHEFCWICHGTWDAHHSCTTYRPPSTKSSEVKMSLQAFQFYSNFYNNQSSSYDKDRRLLEKFEESIEKLQIRKGSSWMETSFYNECVDSLLECRLTLKWSYVFLFYFSKGFGKQLVEMAQSEFSNKVEGLSKLFADVPISEVLNRKRAFLRCKCEMLERKDKLLDTCVDILENETARSVFKRLA